MPVGEIAIRQVVIASRETSALEAAKLMRQHHVGDVVVTEQRAGKCVPIGIVTDRDIVLEVLAQGLDATRIAIGDVMAADLITVSEEEGIFQTVKLMRAKGARRAPVVDGAGALVGIVSLDDLLELLGDELGDLSKLISREQKREAETRGKPPQSSQGKPRLPNRL